jgi:hypothetical protein
MKHSAVSGGVMQSALWHALRLTLVGAVLSTSSIHLSHAQTASASIRGTVRSGEAASPAARIEVTNSDTGFKYNATTDDAGNFSVGGLPPGNYQIDVSGAGGESATRKLALLVGQSIVSDFTLAANQVTLESVTVYGDRVVDLKTSEVGTNVTPEQLNLLPQNSRNFLNFAALAPGVRVTDDENGPKDFKSGAQSSTQTNVFIDGISYKNDILQGGVVGQDQSRGNPFPQNAVQEFRVLTQNFKAEYERASSAIITAVTKSGGNEWSGDAFAFSQIKSLVSQDAVARQRGDAKPEYERLQGGFSVGGPLIEDKLHIFTSFELNKQDREATVIQGGTPVPPQVQALLDGRTGNFPQPFEQRLYFGKLTYQPAIGHQLETTVYVRDEEETKDFGGLTAFENAIDFKVDVQNLLLRYVLNGNRWTNEASIDYQNFEWQPRALNPDVPTQDFSGVLQIGGKDTTQAFQQQRVGIRDDFTFDIDALGQHTFKTGAYYSYLNYDIKKFQNANPLFRFRQADNFEFPFEAFYGTGNPDLSAINRQLGLYFQDDWQIVPRVQLNLGVRWDYETDQLNNHYRTPDRVIDALRTAGLDSLIGRFTTDGSQRDEFTGAIQPRLGASWDIRGDGRTIVHAGWGRYFDRTLFNDILDERFRLQYDVRQFRFSADGAEPGTIAWQDSLLSKAALDALIASGQAPDPELFLIDNDTKPPRTDQLSIGVRQAWAGMVFGATYSRIRGKNLFTYLRGNLNPDGTCCIDVPGFGNVFISSDDRGTRYRAWYFTVDRPYTEASRWGFGIAYTRTRSQKNGGDLFSAFDYATANDFFYFPANDDERHRVVINGIVGLPWGFQLSTLITLGSGLPFTITDDSVAPVNIRRNEGRPPRGNFIFQDAFAYRSVDLRLTKSFQMFDGNLSVALEGFNIFNYDNFVEFDTFIPRLPEVNANFGQPRRAINPRRLQFGVTYAF